MSKSKKEILGFIKLQVPYGKANPSPPIGPALGQKGLNIMEFCKQFNALKLEGIEQGDPIPVVITAYKDKTFVFNTKKPPVSHFIKKAIKISKGSSNPGKDSAGKITMKEITDIAEKKMEDMNAFSLDAAVMMVKGSAVSMGLEVVE